MTKVLNSRPKKAGFGANVPNTMLKYNYSFVFSDDIKDWHCAYKVQKNRTKHPKIVA
jgi:hypothetical protein